MYFSYQVYLKTSQRHKRTHAAETEALDNIKEIEELLKSNINLCWILNKISSCVDKCPSLKDCLRLSLYVKSKSVLKDKITLTKNR